MSLFGPPNIEKMRQAGDVKGLTKALSHKDAGVRREAAEALGELEAVTSVPALVKILASSDEAKVRRAAALALGKIRDRQAYEALVEYLRQERHAGNRFDFSAQAIERLGDPRAVSELFAIVRNGEANQDVIHALHSFHDPRELQVLLEAYPRYQGTPEGKQIASQNGLKAEQLIIQAIATHGPAAIPGLLGLLTPSNWWTNMLVCEMLAGLGWTPGQDQAGAIFNICRKKWDAVAGVGVPAVEPLVAAIQVFRQPAFLVPACLILGSLHDFQSPTSDESPGAFQVRLGDQPAVKALCGLLAAPEPEVRIAAIQTLVRLQATSAAEQIAAQADVPLPSVRAAAIHALAQLPAPDKTAIIIDHIDDPDEVVRAAARHEIEQMGSAALPALARAVDHPVEAVRQYIAERLGQLGDPAGVLPVIRLTEDDSTRVRTAAVVALGSIDSYEAIACLLDAAFDPTNPPALRRTALEELAAPGKRALGLLDDPTAIEILTELLRYRNPEIKLGAIQALSGSGFVENDNQIWEIAANPQETVDVRLAAIRALANSGNPALARAVVALLESDEPAIRREAVLALLALGHREKETFAALALDPDPLVQEVVYRAISQIE